VTRSTIDVFQGEIMSISKAFVLLVSLSAFAFLAACGGNGSPPVNPTPPPSGGFSDSALNGTYVFSVSGTDVNGDPISAAGTLTANGSGTITGGAVDINDVEFSAPAADLTITSSSYKITSDGRGETQLNVTNNPFSSALTLDFVLQDTGHGLVTEFDQNATGSGTIDLQSSGAAASGSYSYILSGGVVVSSTSVSTLASVGNFAVSSGAITGTADFNDGGFAYADQSLSGTIALGPSSTPSSKFTTAQFGTQTFDVIAVDDTHLKLIEMDSGATLSGDAYSETSTTLPASAAFTMVGEAGGLPVAIGGLMTTSGTSISGNADVNDNSTLSPSPISFTGTSATTGARSVLTLSTFPIGTTYVAYPSSSGLLLLEIDDSGMMSGAAYTQSASAALAVPAGFGLNLSGDNTSSGQAIEVDDIAEFQTASGGTFSYGAIDENSEAQTVYGVPLTGTFTAAASGRGTISATASNSSGSSSTLEGVLDLIYYTVDGTTFPFIEMDSGQIATGVFIQQTTPSSSSVARPHAMYVPHLMSFHPHAAKLKKN
jgi:hypothetical protein